MNFLTEDERENRIVSAAYSTAKYGRLVAVKIK